MTASSLDRLTVDDFAGYVGDAFRVVRPECAETLTLVEARASRAASPDDRRRAFSLLFLGESRTAWLPQGIHALEHPALPGLALFLTCIGPAADGRFRYEAAFT